MPGTLCHVASREALPSLALAAPDCTVAMALGCLIEFML